MKISQPPKHLRVKPEGGVVTTRAGIAFVGCVTVALPTEHISPELSPGIFDGAGKWQTQEESSMDGTHPVNIIIPSKSVYVVPPFYKAPYSSIRSRNSASVDRQ